MQYGTALQKAHELEANVTGMNTGKINNLFLKNRRKQNVQNTIKDSLLIKQKIETSNVFQII